MNLANSEWFFSLLVAIVAYYTSITLNGMLQAYITDKLGDSTAKELGYLNFNPLHYFEPFRFFVLLIFHFSWPVAVPINPLNIVGRNKLLRLFFAYTSEGLGHIFFAFISLAVSIIIYGALPSVGLVRLIFYLDASALKAAHQIFPNHSSISIVVAILLAFLVFLNIFMSVLSIIFNLSKYALLIGFEKGYYYSKYSDYVLIFGPLLAIIFFADPMRFYLLQVITWLAVNITALFGIL